jgi:hypothetical protein
MLEVRVVGSLRFVLFPPSALRLGVVRTHPDSPDPELAREAKPLPYTAVAAQWPDTAAALNGCWAGWGKEGRPPGADYRKATSMRLECAYRDRVAGLEVPPLEADARSPGAPGARGGLTIAVRLDGTAYAAEGWLPGDALVAVQLPRALVVNGRVASGLTLMNWRTADDRAALVLLSDGRLALGGGRAESTQAFAEDLVRELGARWAGYPDGGGSLHVLHEDGAGVLQLLRSTASPGRPTPSWIRVVRQVPAAPAPSPPAPSSGITPGSSAPSTPGAAPGPGDLALITPPMDHDPFAGELILQLYRGAMHGRDERLRYLDQIQALGLSSVCLHGGPRELHGAWESLAKECKARTLRAIASWGLDGTRTPTGRSSPRGRRARCSGRSSRARTAPPASRTRRGGGTPGAPRTARDPPRPG